MSVHLLDVNVLISLAWDTHPHFNAARRWLGVRSRRWATCPITELGFVRISSNRNAVPSAGSVATALQGLGLLRKHPKHAFWADDLSPADAAWFAQLQGHQQVTDAYLLALAVQHKGVLATFDSGLKTLARDLLNDAARVELIAV